MNREILWRWAYMLVVGLGFSARPAMPPIALACFPWQATEQQSQETSHGINVGSPVEPTRFDQPFPIELKLHPDLKHVDAVINRQPLQFSSDISSVAWADGGRHLVVGYRSAIIVWDVETRVPVRGFKAKGVNDNFVFFQAETSSLFAWENDLRILDWPSLEPKSSIENLALYERDGGLRIGSLEALTVSPNGKYFAASFEQSGNHSLLKIVDVATGEIVGLRAGPSMEALAWSPDSQFLAVGEQRGIIIFLTPTAELIRPGIRLSPVTEPLSIAISRDQRGIAVCGRDAIGVYEIRGRSKRWYQTADRIDPDRPNLRYNRVEFSNDSNEVIALRYRRHDQTSLVAFNALTGEIKREREVSHSFSDIMQLSPDGDQIVFEDRNNALSICSASSFEPIISSDTLWDKDSFSGDRNFPVGICASSDGNRALTFSAGALTIWDLESGQSLWENQRPDWIRDAAWTRTDPWIVLNRDGNATRELGSAAIEIFDSSSGNLLRTIRLRDERGGPILALSDGRLLACGQHHAYLFDPDGNELWSRQLCQGATDLSQIAVDRDEATVAIVRKLQGSDALPHSGFSQGSIFLLDLESGADLRELLTPVTPERVSFSRDGSTLLASTNNHPRRRGSLQPLVETWDVESGERHDIEAIPDHAQGEDFFRGKHEEITAMIEAYPLLASQQLIVQGDMAVSRDRRLLAIERMPETAESRALELPNWSAVLLLWDIDRKTLLERWTLPSRVWDIDFLADGRMITLNENGTIFVLRTQSIP